MSYVANIQLLSPDGYFRFVPAKYIINIKSINFNRVDIQLADRLETDNKRVLKYNTEKFLSTHPNAVTAKVQYIKSDSKHTELVSAIPDVDDEEKQNILSIIVDRMVKRTKDMTDRMNSEDHSEVNVTKPAAAQSDINQPMISEEDADKLKEEIVEDNTTTNV